MISRLAMILPNDGIQIFSLPELGEPPKLTCLYRPGGAWRSGDPVDGDGPRAVRVLLL
nr:hypothetical protein [Indioceanicola profundi]